VGVFFKDTVESFFGDGLMVVGVCLCITALLLLFAHLTGRNKTLATSVISSRGKDVGWWDAFIIGCAQAVAVLPGLSRSGTTIATGILLGVKKDKVAAFSFLMVILPILGEALLDVKDLLTDEAAQQASVGFLPMVVGFVSSFVVGCAACKWMISLVSRGKLVWFALYCLIMGAICMAW
jgi:undecaprenyl-diphosphatase